jgi:hypothetical protein
VQSGAGKHEVSRSGTIVALRIPAQSRLSALRNRMRAPLSGSLPASFTTIPAMLHSSLLGRSELLLREGACANACGTKTTAENATTSNFIVRFEPVTLPTVNDRSGHLLYRQSYVT